MKTRPELLLLMAGVVALGGCTSDLEGAPCPCAPGWCCWGPQGCKSGPECDVKIAFVPKASNNPVFRLAFEGATKAASDLSSEASGFRVQVPCMAPPELDAEKQADAVRRAIVSRPRGLVVSCISNDALKSLIQSAYEEGIPVITYDSDCPRSARRAFYGIDNRLTGSTAADLLANAMSPLGEDGPKRVAILNGDQNVETLQAQSENLQDREDGFTAQLRAQHPNVEVVDTYYCNETAEDCGRVIEEQIMTGNPDLDGLFVTGLWGLQSACTCDERGLHCRCDDEALLPRWKAAADAATGKLKTVSYDTLPFELELMKRGYVSALISQEYRDWGKESVTRMFHYLTQGQLVGPEARSVPVVAGSEAVDTMLASWEGQDEQPGPDLAVVCDVPSFDE